MVALFAPDGNFQAMTLAPDLPTCLAIIKLMHKAKLGESYFSLTRKGFKVLPIKVTIVQNGDEDRALLN